MSSDPPTSSLESDSKQNMSLVRPVVSSLGSELLWTIRGHQKLLGLVKLGGFGIIAKLPKSQTLAVINPVEFTPQLHQAVKDLEQETNCSVRTLFSPGDWHHLHLTAWSDAFPEAKLYVASDRILRKQPTLKDKAIVLDTVNPVVPELSESFDLLPWLGCRQPHWILLGGDKAGAPRVEHVVFHRQTKTLFITDHLFAPELSKTDPSKLALPVRITCNNIGFAIVDPVAVAKGAQSILDLGPKHVIFSHGGGKSFSINDDDVNDQIDNVEEHITVIQLLKEGYESYFLPKSES